MADGYEALYDLVLDTGDSAEPGDGEADETGDAVGPGKTQGRVVDMASRRSGSAS